MQENVANLEEEFALLQSLGVADIELWNEEQLAATHGAGAGFKRGIYFPKEARIDALAFVNELTAACHNLAKGRLTVVEHAPAVIGIHDVVASGSAAPAHVRIELANGGALTANHCVVATNGMFLTPHLAGILRPCWSYFLALPHPRDPARGSQDLAALPRPPLLGGHSSKNFFTYDFTHDWCVTEGTYRISGADHFSALKAPRALRRCQALGEWTYKHYPHMVWPRER